MTSRAGAFASTCAAALMACSITGQDRGSPERPADAPAPALFRGWLSEILERDHDVARRIYEAALHDDDVPTEHKSIARARLVELLQLGGPSGVSTEITTPVADLIGANRALLEPLDLPRAEFARVLASPSGAEREASLARLRAAVGSARHPTRRFVAATVQRLEQKESIRLQELFSELDVARRDRDAARVERLQREIRRLRAGPRSAGTQYWRLLITRLLVQGRVDEADRYRSRLGLRAPRDQPVPADPEALVRDFEQRLARRLSIPDLPPFERTVMTELRAHLDALSAAGDRAAAVLLIQRLPIAD